MQHKMKAYLHERNHLCKYKWFERRAFARQSLECAAAHNMKLPFRWRKELHHEVVHSLSSRTTSGRLYKGFALS